MILIKAYAVLLAFMFTPHTQVVSVDQASKVLDSSVLIRIKTYNANAEKESDRRRMAGCSGTYVSTSTVLTAAHCFSGTVTDVWVRGVDKKSYPATVLKLDPVRDLALLKVGKVKNHKYARMANDTRVGEKVINVGSPIIFEFLISEGIVSSIDYKIDGDLSYGGKSRYTVTTAMINSGSSGGGAFNEKGELIGVNTMTIGGFFGWAGISLAVDRKTIKGFINGNL